MPKRGMNAFYAFAFLFFSTGIIPSATASIEEGKKLFKAKCASCHSVKVKLTGPALMGVMDRVPGKEWVYKWVNNSTAVRESGDAYAKKIFDEFKGEQMTSFPELAPADIDNILAYIDDAAKAAPEVAAGTPADTAAGDNSSTIFLGIIMVVLLILAVILSKAARSLDHLVKTKTGEPIPEPVPLRKILTHPRTIALVVVILFIGGCYNLVDNAVKLGRSPGYQPVQPIAFSHKVHAGINKIDCKYCHSGAEKSQHAAIPSVNQCMNCHKAIQTFSGGAVFTGAQGTDEIKKLLTAFELKEPIKWVKVHDLPDHVYFNHSQHVTVGQVACQTCHGPVEEMDEVFQFAPLSMGWCVNCHRTTESSQFASNTYYNTFAKLHEEVKEGKMNEVITVERLGGIECQRCHY